MEKQKITVGSCSMWAEVIPVNEIFEEMYACNREGRYYEEFFLVEADGIYLVGRRRYFAEEKRQIEYKAFLHKEDAVDFIEMHGIETGMKTEEDDEDASDNL